MSVDFRFHHVGLTCKQLASEREEHVRLGYVIEGAVFEDSKQKIRGQFLVNHGMRVEILEPLSDDSPVWDFIRRGIKMYHQCFEVDQIEEAIEHLVSARARILVAPTPAVAFANRTIAFVMTRSLSLVELLSSV